MHETPKRIGMMILPSVHKRLKTLAAQTETPLWKLTTEACLNWLAEQGEFPDKHESGMNSSTKTKELPPNDQKVTGRDRVTIGTKNQDGDTLSGKNPDQAKSPGPQVLEPVREADERAASEVSLTRSDLSRIESEVRAIRGIVEAYERRVGRVEALYARPAKAKAKADKNRRLDSAGARKHPRRA